MKNAAAALLFLIVPALAPAQTSTWQWSGDARIFAGYFVQQSLAGSDGMTSTSWVMGGAEYGTPGRHLAAHAMLSPDVLLNGDCGQPRLFPESFDCGDGESISHPLVMDLSLRAESRISNTHIAFTASAVGEPAFGPPPHFMRPSAAYDPGAPLMHHFFTPAHSAHGQVTASVARGWWMVEASAFNGQPTADRYRIDLGPLHARALRLSWRISAVTNLQVSGAYFPEEKSGAHHGHAGIMRAYSVTASGEFGNVRYTTGCAAHHIGGETPAACLVESTVQIGKNLWFGRFEGGRRLESLVEVEILPDGSHAHITKNYTFATGEAAIGYTRLLTTGFGWQPSIGARAAITAIPEFFEIRYVDKQPLSLQLYISARPALAHAH